MSGFDAYTDWLEIPADRRPPTHYDLLGLAQDEVDAERIHKAAMERMKIVRRYHLGEHAADALRLQNEISRALGCLRDPDQRRRYDEQFLRQTIDGRSESTSTDAPAAGYKLADTEPEPPPPAAPFHDQRPPEVLTTGVRLPSIPARPAPEPSIRPVWPWIALSATGLVLVAGVAAGLLFNSNRQQPADATEPVAVAKDGTDGKPRNLARKFQSPATVNQLQQIGRACLDFHDASSVGVGFGAVRSHRFPASTYDQAGKPLLSWRVYILPHLEELGLFQQFRLNEPWDSEHNRPLAARMPAVFKNPDFKDPERTVYLQATGAKALFPKRNANDPRDYPREAAVNRASWAHEVALTHIPDGTSNTIMVVEADPDRAVIWTKPDDLDFDPTAPTQGLGGLRKVGFYALFCDGNVVFIPNTIDPDALRHRFDPQDGHALE